MRARPISILVALGVLLWSPAIAVSDGAKTSLAQFFAIDEAKVTKATGYRLAGVTDYTQIIVGAYMENEREQTIVALMRCGPRVCRGARAWLGPTEVDFLGLADLAGTPGPLGAGHRIEARTSWTTTLSGPTKKLRFPVLVFERRDHKEASGTTRFGKEVRGTERHEELVLVSLRKTDARSPKILTLSTADLWPSGAGTTTTYTLEKGTQKAALDIVGSEQRHLDNDSACLRPDPVEVRYVYKDSRYEKFDPLLRKGCH